MGMVFVADKQYVNGLQMPFPKVDSCNIHFEHNRIDVNIKSRNNLGLKLLNFGLKTFKALILASIKPFMEDGGFPIIANLEIGNILNESHGKMSIGPL
jgi:hypothetical protein